MNRRTSHSNPHQRPTVRLGRRDAAMDRAISDALRARLLGTLVRLGGSADLDGILNELPIGRAAVLDALQVAVHDGLVCPTPGGRYFLRDSTPVRA